MRRLFHHHIAGILLGPAILLFLLHLGGSVTLAAETLKKYQADVAKIKADLTRLYSFSSDDFNEGWTKEQQIKSENDFFAELSEYLPPQETVEWNGTTVEVDNRWLHEKVEALKQLPRNSLERDAVVTEIHQRLSALEGKLDELLNAKTGARSKDEEKQKLAEILKRVEYQPPEKKEETALQRWGRVFLDWLRDLLPKPSQIDPGQPQIASPGISPTVVQAGVIIFAVAVLAFVVWRFAPVFRNRRRKKKEKKEKGERIILGEKLAADESSATLFDQAEQMAREGNFRGAIRKGYIALLCELGDRKIVRLAQHKTNRDYLSDVRKNPGLHGGVRDLTFMFENHWYGLASASEEEWSAFRENYRHSTGNI